jgi:copper transport protein
VPGRLARALALLLLLALAPAPLAAHAVLVEAQPGDGVRLEQPPAVLRLRFNEPVTPVAVRLLDARGAEIPGVRVEPEGATILVRPPAPLARGAYLLSYRVTSLDAHPVGATLRFGVGADPAAGIGDGEDQGRATGWIGVAARWLAYLTALGSAGLALFLLLVQPPAPVADRARLWLARLAAAGLAAVALRLGVGGLALTGLPPLALASAAPWLAAAGTTLGGAALVAGLGLALLAAAPGRAWACAGGALLVGLSLALTGHAATAQPRWLTGPALMLHGLCGAFWLGSFAPLLRGVRVLPAGAAHAMLRRFSAVAAVAVGALVLAGLALAWIQLEGRATGLWQTAYGLRLAGKLVLVACLLALAALNRLVLAPGMAQGDPWARRGLRRTLAADLALGLGVLAVTASFPLDPPPRALPAAGKAQAEEAGVSIVATAQGRQAVLSLLPGRTGANRLEAWVTDAGGAPVAAQEASLRLALPEAGIEPARFPATMPRPGAYAAEGVVLPRAGRWRLRLDLLVDDFTRLTFTGEIAVP